MNNFPHIMSFVSNTNEDNAMYNFDDINRILDEMVNEEMVEPIDDPPCIQTDFYDWAEVVGISNEIEPNVEWA